MTYWVSQRTHEIGIRMALGAGQGRVLQLVLRQSLLMVLAGLVIGIGGAFALTRLMSSLLFGVNPTDVATFLGVSLMLACIGIVAGYVPARRAANVDPMIALRSE
jgi:putative ABC transport system permease protein